jgi:hypothetical protein
MATDPAQISDARRQLNESRWGQKLNIASWNGSALGDAAAAGKTWLLGGDATKGMQTQPQTADYQRGYLQNDFMNRGAPMMDASQANQARGQQSNLAGMLFQQATGATPGAGELAVQRQAGNAMAQQTSMAQMARGANAALAARNAARMNAGIGVNAAGQAGIAQMQDQQAAQGQLAGLLGHMRGQDIQTAGANQQSQLAQQQLQLGGLAQLLGVDQAALQQDLAKRQIDAGDKGMLGSAMQVAGQIGAAYATGGMGGGAAPGMSPIAKGYPGAGGYYTPGM